MWTKFSPPQKGMTLPEIAVGIVIFSIVLFATYKIFFSTRKIHGKISAELALNQEGTLAIKKLKQVLNEASYIQGENPPFLNPQEVLGFETSDPRNTVMVVRQEVDFSRNPTSGLYKSEIHEFLLVQNPPPPGGGEILFKLVMKRKILDFNQTTVLEEIEKTLLNRVHSFKFYRLKNESGSFNSKSISLDFELKGNEENPDSKGRWESTAFIRGEKI